MNEPLLKVENLAVHFHVEHETVEAVKGVSFQIERGETLALVGESGSGKSASALSVLQLLPYPPAAHPSGSVQLDGEELMGAPLPTLRSVRGNRVSMIFQEPMTSLNPLHSIEKQISEVLTTHQLMPRQKARERCVQLLLQVGIAEAEKRLTAFPHELSGGQRQRVMIAMALANEPDLLIADEPTTALDVTVQAQILALLKEQQAQLGMAMLFITHDLGIVRKMADRVCVMKEGEIVEKGETERIFNEPRHAYTQRLLQSEPQPLEPRETTEEIVVRAENLRVWYPIRRGVLRRSTDYVKAVDGIDIAAREGRTVGVVGESGSGKTTLGLALLRLISSDGGVYFGGKPIQGLRSKQLRPLRRHMQIIFQDPYGSLSPRMSVAQIIEEGLKVHRIGDTAAERERIVIETLEEVGLDPETRRRYPHEFSGGQRQRISVARAMAIKPRFVVLDEPTSSLDASVQAQTLNLLLRLQQDYGLAYLFISHDLKVIRAVADEVIVMRQGKAVESGPAEELFDNPQNPYTLELLSAAFDK